MNLNLNDFPWWAIWPPPIQQGIEENSKQGPVGPRGPQGEPGKDGTIECNISKFITLCILGKRCCFGCV